MGQRLIVHCMLDNEQIATVYYHWSAYTASAWEEAINLVNDADLFSADYSAEEYIYNIIRSCERYGGGVEGTERELEAVKKLFPDNTFKTDAISRNSGLVAITPEGMKNQCYWSEGDVYIDITNKTIENDIYWFHEDIFEAIDDLDLDDERVSQLEEHPDYLLGPVCLSDAEINLHILNNSDYIFYINETELISITA